MITQTFVYSQCIDKIVELELGKALSQVTKSPLETFVLSTFDRTFDATINFFSSNFFYSNSARCSFFRCVLFFKDCIQCVTVVDLQEQIDEA